MFNNKIFNIIIRTLGALSILFVSCLGIITIIEAIVFYDIQTIVVTCISFILAFLIVGIVCFCMAEFLEWVVDKLSK